MCVNKFFQKPKQNKKKPLRKKHTFMGCRLSSFCAMGRVSIALRIKV